MPSANAPGTVSFGSASLAIGDDQLDFLPATDREQRVLAVLRNYLLHLVESTAFYRTLYQGLDIARDIQSAEDLRAVPLLTPARLRAASPLDLLPDSLALAIRTGSTRPASASDDPVVESFASSGSTGRPKITYYTKRDWELNSALYAYVMGHIPWNHRNRVFCLFNPGHIGGAAYKRMVQDDGGLLVSKHFASLSAEQALRDLLNRPEGPFNALAVPPRPPRSTKVQKGTTLLDLLEAEARLGVNYIGENVRTIIVNGAPIRHRDDPLNIVELVHRKNEAAGVPFRATFSDQGGSAETLYNFASREPDLPREFVEPGRESTDLGMHALHLVQGRNWIEVINPRTGRHVKHRERGLLVVSSMKHGSAWVRYLVGDSAVFLDPREEPCPTGRTTPRIFGIERIHDRARLEAGCAAGGN